MTASDDDHRRAAARVGAKASLLDVRMRRIDAELLTPAAEPPYTATLEISQSFDVEAEHAVYTLRYAVEASTEDEKKVAYCHVEFVALYRLPEVHDFSEDDFAAFGEVSVIFSLHPYAREAVQSVTTRFGLPPLVLDVMRSPLDGPVAQDP